jgi:ABC-2 type transport system ATP-binding protein
LFKNKEKMSIQVKNITRLFNEQKALDDVSFTINTGEIVGFIGPNGAGKSTMMKIITGLLPQTSGNVSVNNFDVIEHPFEIRKCIGYLPENNPLYPTMYIKEYLEMIAGIYKIKTNLNEIIEQTGLQIEQHKKIGQLSKGFRQRVGLAQALIHKPSVLILDEPTTGLDPNQIIEIRNLIKKTGSNKTIMLSTHLMQEVEAICDRIIIINKGKIIANGTKDEVIKSTNKTTSTIHIEFNKSTDKNWIENIEGVIDVRLVKENHWLIQFESSSDIREQLFAKAVENKLSVLSLQKMEKSLEQAFQELTSQQ